MLERSVAPGEVDEGVPLVLVNVAERQSVDAQASAARNTEPLTG